MGSRLFSSTLASSRGDREGCPGARAFLPLLDWPMPAGGPRSPFNCYRPNNARRAVLTSSVGVEKPEWAAGAGGLNVEIDPVGRGGAPADFTYGDLRSGQSDSFSLDSSALTFIVILGPSTVPVRPPRRLPYAPPPLARKPGQLLLQRPQTRPRPSSPAPPQLRFSQP